MPKCACMCVLGAAGGACAVKQARAVVHHEMHSALWFLGVIRLQPCEQQQRTASTCIDKAVTVKLRSSWRLADGKSN